MYNQDDSGYDTNAASDLNDRADSNLFSLILALFLNTGIIYGYYDGQPYTRKNIREEVFDDSDRESTEK